MKIILFFLGLILTDPCLNWYLKYDTLYDCLDDQSTISPKSQNPTLSPDSQPTDASTIMPTTTASSSPPTTVQKPTVTTTNGIEVDTTPTDDAKFENQTSAATRQKWWMSPFGIFGLILGIAVFTCGILYLLCVKLGDCFYILYQNVAQHYTEHQNPADVSLEAQHQPLIDPNNRIQETIFINENHNADRGFTNENYNTRSETDSNVTEHDMPAFQSAQTTLIVNATVEPSTSTPVTDRTPTANFENAASSNEIETEIQDEIEESAEKSTTTRRRKGASTPKIRKTVSPPRKQPKRECKRKLSYKY